MVRFLLLGLIFLLSACASSHKVIGPQDELALQEMQTREFEAPFKMTYASVLSVLQDVGYIVENADGDSGLITAKSPTDSGTSYSLLWGFGKKNKTTRVTAFVEPIGTKISKVRFNFVNIVADSNIYGATSQVDRPVEDPSVYSNVFEKVEETIFIKASMQ